MRYVRFPVPTGAPLSYRPGQDREDWTILYLIMLLCCLCKYVYACVVMHRQVPRDTIRFIQNSLTKLSENNVQLHGSAQFFLKGESRCTADMIL